VEHKGEIDKEKGRRSGSTMTVQKKKKTLVQRRPDNIGERHDALWMTESCGRSGEPYGEHSNRGVKRVPKAGLSKRNILTTEKGRREAPGSLTSYCGIGKKGSA